MMKQPQSDKTSQTSIISQGSINSRSSASTISEKSHSRDSILSAASVKKSEARMNILPVIENQKTLHNNSAKMKQNNVNTEGCKSNTKENNANTKENAAQTKNNNTKTNNNNAKTNNNNAKKNNDNAKKNNDNAKTNNDNAKKNNDNAKTNNDNAKTNNDNAKTNNDNAKINNNNSKTKNNNEKENSGYFSSAGETLKKQKIKEILAKKKQEEEERERFVKETAEKKAAERAEIIKQAKRLILYRKPMCRRINRALLVSECYRELDAQLKFQETVKWMDREEDERYVNLMKSDVAKYEEEQQQTAKEQLEKKRKYASGLKEQIEENEKNANEKETEEFEAGKQDQINITKYLEDIKEHEERELLNKKQKLKQFFKDAIEEKKRFDLKLKQEEEFEDRAIEAYQNAKARIKKMHKQVQLKKKENIELKAKAITEMHQKFVHSTEELENKILKKGAEEQEEKYKEKESKRKDHEISIRKQVQDYQKEIAATKLKQFQEAKDLKVWEMMQRFKRAEYNENVKLEEQAAEWNKKKEYGNALLRHISQKKLEREQDKNLEEIATHMKEVEVIEKENQRVLDYANEVIDESRNVRPLYPILKAVQECKKEMGLLPLRKKEGTVTTTTPKRRQRRPRVCTKFVPEEEICYL